MRRLIFSLSFFIFLGYGVLAQDKVLIEGYIPGAYTMDYDAALAYAKKNKMSVFLDFTGSDWCGWCQLMQRQVFTKKEWKDWTLKNMVLVTLDFPRSTTIVPQKYKNRNSELQSRFQVQGYPTYVVLDFDGITELGRLGAGQEKTASSFISELKQVQKNSRLVLEGFVKNLSGEQATVYQKDLDRLIAVREGRGAKTDDAEVLLVSLRTTQLDYAFSQFKPDEKRRYETARDQFELLQAELNAWLDTKPQNTEKNLASYESYLSRISKLEAEMLALLALYGA